MDKTFIYSLSTLVGTIIGVGLFALPYIAAKTGLWIILGYFLGLSLLTIFIHLLFAEIVMCTKERHRLPGYAEIYLGKKGKQIASLAMILGLGGALLVYLIVGGVFLTSLLSPFFGGNNLIYTSLYFLAGALIIYAGIGVIAKIELFGLILFFIILLGMFNRGLPFINLQNLTRTNLNYLFLPYGPILFALWGTALIPEIVELMKNRLKDLKKLIPLAILIPALTYLFFILLVTGISGSQTSSEAINGLKNFLGNGIIVLGLFFGLLTTFTSFISLGLTLKKIFWYDFKISHGLSWLIACFGPFLLYLAGLKDFIKIIGLLGGAMIGLEGILIILIYNQTKRKKEQEPAWSLPLSSFFANFLIIFFVLGIFYEIIYFFK